MTDSDPPLLRADQLLVEKGLVRSRTRAQRLIKHGRVSLLQDGNAQRITKTSERLPTDCVLDIVADAEERYASRAGLKLEGLLQQHGIRFDGQTLVDIGQSTGGFTDCAVAFGALRVIGIEVGHAQLDPRLREDPRVHCLEGINARALPIANLEALAPQGIDGVLMDVSFISQTLILPEIGKLLRQGKRLYSLVKPQFELNREDIDQRGLVRAPDAQQRVYQRIEKALDDAGMALLDWRPSSITGGDGNQEWMILAQKQ